MAAKPDVTAADYDGSRRRNCRDCQQFQLTDTGPRCRFRGGRPSGVCAVFSRLNPARP